MSLRLRLVILGFAAPLLALQPACDHRATVEEEVTCSKHAEFYGQAVDILFVIDDSGSMMEEQQNLVQNFPRLIEALRSPRLGPDNSGKPCTEKDPSGCQLPDLHIGVVSTSMAIGNGQIKGCYSNMPSEAKLRNKPRVPGCTPPSGPWISYRDGQTNVPGSGKDPVQKVKDAFSCIAKLGINGCGSEQPLEAAYKALNGKTNPGFLRNNPGGDDALLVVVFITDEDDCSAHNHDIFKVGFSPKTPICMGCYYRCFHWGVTCDVNGYALGTRKNCKPETKGKYLHTMDRYINFFKNLKRTPAGQPDSGRVIMTAIAGPTTAVHISDHNGNPNLDPSCVTKLGEARPAIRIESVVHSFAPRVLDAEIKAGVPFFVDDKGVKREQNLTSICNANFAPPLERLGRSIVATLRTICLQKPTITDNGGVICGKGDLLGTNYNGKQVTCAKGCLDQANLSIQETQTTGGAAVPRCDKALFNPALAQDACTGASCPCWRLVPRDTCRKRPGHTPYAVEIMRTGKPPRSAQLNVCALKSVFSWGSTVIAGMPQCR